MNLVSFPRAFSRTFSRSTVHFLLSRRDLSSAPEEAESKCSGKKPDVLGINIGFSNAYAAIMDGENPKIITNSVGESAIPSIIAFYEPNVSHKPKVVVGSEAKYIYRTTPQACVLGISRMIGLKFGDPALQKELIRFPVKESIMQNEEGDFLFVANGKKCTAEVMFSNILKFLKQLSSISTKKLISKAVVAVPPHFPEARRLAIFKAGQRVGLEILKFISEPIAAALSYHLERNDGCFFVYDFGGGSFDCTVVQSYNGVLKAVASCSHTSTGGTTFDGEVVKYFLHKTKEEVKDKLRTEVYALTRMLIAAEEVKKKLGSGSETISLRQITINERGESYDMPMISGNEIEDILEKWLPKTGKVCESCLQKANITVDDIDGVILVGGMCNIPQVQKFVRNFFGKDPLFHPNRDVGSAIAVGAAIKGSTLY